jgi:hypothetical protein
MDFQVANVVLYPQKLWISLCIAKPNKYQNAGDIAYLLPWLKNDQDVWPLLISELQA